MKRLFVFFLASITLLVVLNFLRASISQAQTVGDWPMFLKDSQHSAFVEDNQFQPPLRLKWTYQTADHPSSTAVAGGKVFFKSESYLQALDANTGNLLWKSDHNKTGSHTSPAVWGKTVISGNPYSRCLYVNNCSLEAFDTDTGNIKWTITNYQGTANPTIKDGVAYFGTDNNYVYAVNITTGVPLWRSIQIEGGIVTVPAVLDNKVFVGTWGGNVYALNIETGQVIWQYYAGGVVHSSPAVNDNKVYVGSGSAFVHALNAETGGLVWKSVQTTDSVWGSPVVAYGKVYVQDLAGKVYALDAQNGNIIWSYKTGATPSSSYSSPAVVNGVVYIGSQDKNIYAFDANTGNVLWRYETGGTINSSPAIANSLLYIGSDDGKIYAFEMSDGFTPTPTPTPTPIPTPTPFPTIGPFELPISYEGRPNSNPETFKSAFWSKLTATFDHILRGGNFEPFTGNIYSPNDCPRGIFGITCYNSHNGTDFSQSGGQEILSVAKGTVYYTSEHSGSSCNPEKGGFGCVVIVSYLNNLYGLYAHLSQINVNAEDSVNQSTVLGLMGDTGCPSCGVHLHFGVLKPTGIASFQTPKMSKKDWQELLYLIKPSQTPKYKPACSYRAPNGLSFAFQDPSGWAGSENDPWSFTKKDGGCGITSPYLWKYDIGIGP